MADMLHCVHVAAPAAKVYAALTTQPGLAEWWTADCEAEPRMGSAAVFGFGNRGTVFRMRVAELAPDERVVWECSGDEDEWRGTRLLWDIAPADAGCEVRFTHAGWSRTDGWFALCNTTWGALMHRLRDYAEGKSPGPLFTG